MIKARDYFVTAAFLLPLVVASTMFGKWFATHVWPGPPTCIACPECEVCKECPEPEYPEGFPVEDWVCVTTEEDFQFWMWLSGQEEALLLYEDTVGEQQEELEWWREHCDYEAAARDRDLKLTRELNEFRKRIRLQAAERAIEERASDEPR